MSIKVFIADDSTLFREGIKIFLGTSANFSIVGEAANVFDAAQQIGAAAPDVVLLDYDIPGLDCADAIRLLKERRPATEIIVLAENGGPERAVRAVEAGASGYVLKDIDPESLAQAIVDVCNGCTLMNPRLARHLVEQFRALARSRPENAVGQLDGLTSREREILVELTKGATDREIADRMYVTTTTVKSHIRSIFRKIGVKNRTQAAVHMFKSGRAH